MLSKQTDQLRNDHGRMSIIDLNGSVVSQVVEIGAAGNALVQNQLSGVADHEILLVHAQQASFIIGIVRVEEQSQVLFDFGFIKVNAIFYDALIHRFQVEEAKPGGMVVVACHIQVIETGGNGEAAKGNLVAGFGFGKPAFLLHPRIRSFLLQVFFVENLLKQAIVVVQADTVAV